MDTRQQPVPSPEKTTYSDSSGAIFSMYIDRAQKFDKENVDNWNGQANGILVFTGLFSSTVATFITISYQNLQQDPNIVTQSLLAQISQQLSNGTTGITSSSASPSTQTSFTPSASVVFVNSVWFLSLVLSLTCALMATLLQQWARRYFQMIQRHNAPHVRAHIREYFAQGARRFHISTLVEVLPSLLLISVLLFFAGLVVFAFGANHIVAYAALTIVASCFLSYIALTLMSLLYHDCPYQTPLTAPLWFCAQIILLFLFSIAHYGARKLRKLNKLRGVFTENMAESFQDMQNNKAKSLSEGMTSILESSAKRVSMDTYRSALGWMLGQLDDDYELEEFVVEIPGLYNSEALVSRNDSDDPQNTIHAVLAVLPGPTSFDAPLPWSIIQLAQRAITNGIPESVRRRRIMASLRALYHIPGAIRDVLSPYASTELYCLAILPLLNTPESLEIIDELWDTSNDDVALSVRCTAAVVADFMISPPRRTLDYFLAPHVPFIGDDEVGRRFLSKRLGLDAGVEENEDGTPAYSLNSDDARLQNRVSFFADTIGWKNWWTSDHVPHIDQHLRELFDARHSPGYRAGRGMFDQHGDRTSPAFVPAAQQDLIALTGEILIRYRVADAAPLQHEAPYDASAVTMQMARTAEEVPQFLTQFLPQSLAQSLEPSLALSRLPSLTSLRSRSQSLASSLAPSRTSLRSQSLSPLLAQSLVRWLAPSLAPTRSQSLAQSLELLLAPSLPPSLLQSLAPSRSRSLAQWLAQWLEPSLAPSRSQSLTQWLAQLLAPSLAPAQSQWLARSLAQLPAPSLAQPPAQSQAQSLAQSLAQFVAGVIALLLAVLRAAGRTESPVRPLAVSLVCSLSQLLATLLGELLEQLPASSPAQIQVMLQSLERAQAEAVDSIEMVARALQAGPESLRLHVNDASTPRYAPSAYPNTPQATSATTVTTDADSALVLAPIRSADRPIPPRTESRLYSSVSSFSVGLATITTDGRSNSPTEQV